MLAVVGKAACLSGHAGGYSPLSAPLLRSPAISPTVSAPISLWRIVILSGALFLLSGCHKTHKNADTLLDAEEYEAAAQSYTALLGQDPRDAQAIVGRTKARNGWIDKKLIDVRMLRLSGQAHAALDLLTQIIAREREWQFSPVGAVQYTQEEETDQAVQFVAAQLDAWRTNGPLLRARAFLQQYRPVFASPSLVKKYEDLLSLLMDAARAECLGQARELDASHPYHAIFVARYCQSWGITIPTPFDPGQVRAAGLFNELAIAFSVTGIPDVLQQELRHQLTQSFKKTAWYDPAAKLALPVQVVAGFTTEETKTSESAIHEYTVQVPYTSMVPQTRRIPYTTYFQRCDGYSCVSVPETTYRYETYNVPATRYRDEPRQFPYERWRHHQALGFHATVRALVGGTDAASTRTQNAAQTDTTHTHQVPEVGLAPDPLTLPDPLQWLKKEMSTASTDWGQALSKSWSELYCAPPAAAETSAELTDHVFRCLQDSRTTPPPFVDAWFKQRFNGGRAEVDRWLTQTAGPPAWTRQNPGP